MSSQVPADHRLRNKSRVTPFNHLDAPPHEVSWKEHITPQVLWIALLHEFNGYRRGQDIALLLSRAARLLTDDTMNAYYAASDYGGISTDRWITIRRHLHAYGCLGRVTNALTPLKSCDKEAPFSELLRDAPSISPDGAEQIIKSAVRRLSMRCDSWESTMVQYTVIKIASASKRVKVVASLPYAHSDAISDYPNTPKSIEIATHIRTLITMLFNPHVSFETMGTSNLASLPFADSV